MPKHSDATVGVGDGSLPKNEIYKEQARVEEARSRIKITETLIEEYKGTETYERRKKALRGSRAAADYSESAFKRGDNVSGELALDISTTLVDVALSMTPGVSWGKDLYEAYTGENLVTGEKLTEFERTMAILGSVTLGIGSKFGKGAKIVDKGIEIFDKIDAAGDASRSVDRARSLVDSAGKAKGIAKGVKSNTVNWPKGEHAMQRLLERGITRDQADKILDTGRKFYDAKTDSIVVFAERSAITAGKGKTKLIGVAIDPATKNVKTVLRESRSFEKLPARFIEVTP